MSAPEIHLVIPGRLDQKTGGYLYDARMAEGLSDLGWEVVVHSLEGGFPDADSQAEASLGQVLGGLAPGATVLVDGLAIGALRGRALGLGDHLRLLALVHHPLADETGLSTAERDRFFRLEQAGLARADGVIVTSAFTADRLESFGVSRSRVRVVEPGVDPAPEAVGPRAGEPPYLLCVATLIPRKGQDVLVRALARIKDLRWRCVCAGSLTRAPEFAAAVREQVAAEGLADRVEFPGEYAPGELEELYHTASLFVLPSYYEGFGMVLAEALVRGLPIVSTTGGAIPGTVPPGAGVLVAPGDDLALADVLRSLLTEVGAERLASLSAGAKEYGHTLPSWKRASENFARAIVELTADG